MERSDTHHLTTPHEVMGIAEFIIGPAYGRTRWLRPSYKSYSAACCVGASSTSDTFGGDIGKP